ncbi:MAG: agmatine deiminase [Oribacterium sp.]|nr:agmatine deiminase [Oribacterium sp.]
MVKRWKESAASQGFHMPGEYEPHRGTLLIWPVRPGSWPYQGREAKKVFLRIADELSRGEQVFILADDAHAAEVEALISGNPRISVLEIPTDDAWARDVGPSFVVNSQTGEVRGTDWEFNAWGGAVDGLYAHWDRDNAAAAAICETLGYDFFDARDFVLEGGSIHCDGEGTVLVTKACLLSAGRNPALSRSQIEERLKETLDAEKVIWLPRGIYNDETNEHVDNVCAFVRPGEVVLAWTDRQDDPQYALSLADLKVLTEETDARGRHFLVHKLPIPDVPVTIRPEELSGYCFEEGEDTRETGERLAASYVNFYIGNEVVLLPAFGDENAASDQRAREILAGLFPERRVVSVPARAIIVGGGNIHCITQQIPEGKAQRKTAFAGEA